MDAAVHADRLHALQELDVQEGLRRRAVREQGLVQGERVEGPLHDPLEFRFSEKVRLAQDVDEGKRMPELHGRTEQDGGDEAARPAVPQRSGPEARNVKSSIWPGVSMST